MRIHEAIEQAGPCGKIRLSHWPEELSVINNDGTLEYGNTKEPVGLFRASEVTSPNWEVIAEERIEVGDTVYECDEHKCRVLSMSFGGACTLLDTNIENHCACQSFHENLTLIRKGSKRHVFEVQFKVRTDSDGNTYVVPMGVNKCHFLYGKGLAKGPAYNFVNGKEYDMTITERK